MLQHTHTHTHTQFFFSYGGWQQDWQDLQDQKQQQQQQQQHLESRSIWLRHSLVQERYTKEQLQFPQFRLTLVALTKAGSGVDFNGDAPFAFPVKDRVGPEDLMEALPEETKDEIKAAEEEVDQGVDKAFSGLSQAAKEALKNTLKKSAKSAITQLAGIGKLLGGAGGGGEEDSPFGFKCKKAEEFSLGDLLDPSESTIRILMKVSSQESILPPLGLIAPK